LGYNGFNLPPRRDPFAPDDEDNNAQRTGY
jgi:hypothetical protein